jgi:hypothetical protein
MAIQVREKIIQKTIENIQRQSRVAVFGSNYLMFDRINDPNCSKCLGGIEEVGPTRLNQFTFDLSLEAANTLTERAIDNNVVYLPVDLIKGIGPNGIKKIREGHRIPGEFQEIMKKRSFDAKIREITKEKKVKPGELLYGFESEFRRGAQKILEKIIKGREGIQTRRRIREDGREIVEAQINDMELIPLGIETDGEGPRIAFCQMIFVNILRRFENLGITDLLVYHGEYERICGNQALSIAYKLGLKMNVRMAFFEENKDGTFRITAFERYPQKLGLALDL